MRQLVAKWAGKAKKGLKVLSTALVGGFISVPAFAALPTEATDAFTALETDGLAMIAAGWPVVAAIVGGLILIGIFKRVASKAAG